MQNILMLATASFTLADAAAIAQETPRGSVDGVEPAAAEETAAPTVLQEAGGKPVSDAFAEISIGDEAHY